MMAENEDLYVNVFSHLKALGVKVPKIKKFKSIIAKQETPVSDKGCRVFGVCLSEQEWISEGEYPLPKFISLATAYLQKFIHKEVGLFRKAGNIARQKKLRVKLERGETLQDADPNDVAALLKLWLRELPVPIIPPYLQDLFMRCHNLSDEKERVSGYLMTFLLLPPHHLHTLKHLLRFLFTITLHIQKNRMSTYNLALMMAPNIFTSTTVVDPSNNSLIYQHTAIFKDLIENSHRVGEWPPSFRRTSELTASLDVLDKAKKKSRNGSVQDIFNGFRKLVGQNGSLKNPEEEDFVRVATVSRHTLSLDELDDEETITPNSKGSTKSEKGSSSGRTRRKSFGALLLRKKEKKRIPKQSESTFTLNSEEEKKSSFLFNLKSITPLFADTKFQFNNLNYNITKKESNPLNLNCELEDPSKLLPTNAEENEKKPKIKYSKSCTWHIAQKPETMKACASSEVSNFVPMDKDAQVRKLSPYKSTLSRAEAFSIKPLRNKSPDSTLGTRNLDYKGVKPKMNSGSLKGLNRNCSHSQTSLCNVKCDKNKSVTDRRSSEKTVRQGSLTENRRKQNYKSTVKNDLTNNSPSPVIKSPTRRDKSLSAVNNDIPPRPSLTPTKTEEPQSLDLELSVLLQNFCLSPPNDSSEIHLSIGITAARKSPDVKMNVSQHDNKERSPNNVISEVIPKPRKRLSSKSDSRIPRLKKVEANRPNSFSGSVTGYKNKSHRIEKDHGSIKHNTKIPIMFVENEKSEIIPMQEESVSAEDQNTSNIYCNSREQYTIPEEGLGNSCYMTPNGSVISLESVSWRSGSQYLSAISTPPSHEVSNKRESIAKILKENSGHVQAKVNLYDSKLQSTSSSNCSSNTKSGGDSGKLLRASSEKYPPGRRSNRNKLANSSSYDSANRCRSLKYRSFDKSNLQPFPKFRLTALDTPSPKKSINGKTSPRKSSPGKSCPKKSHRNTSLKKISPGRESPVNDSEDDVFSS